MIIYYFEEYARIFVLIKSKKTEYIAQNNIKASFNAQEYTRLKSQPNKL